MTMKMMVIKTTTLPQPSEPEICQNSVNSEESTSKKFLHTWCNVKCVKWISSKLRHNTGYKNESSRKDNTAGACVMCQWVYGVTAKCWAAVLLKQTII
jgi:hypothetical protein